MKTLLFIFLLATILIPENAKSNDNHWISTGDHEYLIMEYLAGQSQYEIEERNGFIQVVIMDIMGNTIRRTEIRDDDELKIPRILRPMIDKAYFLLETEGEIYYLYPENIETRKKIS